MMNNFIMEAQRQWNEQRGKKLVKSLVKRGFQSEYFPSIELAKDYIYGLIPSNASIGLGGSVTLRQMGLVLELKNSFENVYDHWEDGLTKEEINKLRKKQLNSDVFLTSTNAITVDGRLINTDASGNRVAAMIFGPRKTIVIVGINKIVKDVEEGLARIKKIAPLNFIRANKMNYQGNEIDSPCIKDGICMDCWPPKRHCVVTTIIEGVPKATQEYYVLVIGKELGY